MLLIVSEVYRQQLWLWQNNKQSIEDRIVSLSQPHIRPIVRGKAGKPVEFGAKLSVSCFEGYVFLYQLAKCLLQIAPQQGIATSLKK